LYAKGGGTRAPGGGPAIGYDGPATSFSPYRFGAKPGLPLPVLTMISDEVIPGFCPIQVLLFIFLFFINFFLHKITKIVTRTRRIPMTIPAIAPPGSARFRDEV
jgi:hypothetical protein